MDQHITGRQQEKQILARMLSSNEPEFLAIYGRRRVGKTYLIKEYFEDRSHLFELTGEKGASLAEQLQNFTFAYQSAFPDRPRPRPSSWREALNLLATTIDSVHGQSDRRVVLFFDELPWLASRRSKFLTALDHFWNSWGNRRRNLILVVCGSATSWMIDKLIHNKGGLYNRVTAQMRLQPFTLAEVEAYLRQRRVNLGRKDILELYMCLGGIPQYLRGAQRGESVALAVDRLCFSKDGLLRDELANVLASLFDNHERHLALIRALAQRRWGTTRQELAQALGRTSGGGLSRVLSELEQSAFVSRAACFGRSRRDALYRLIDEHCLFHLVWIERLRGASGGEGHWIGQRAGRPWQAWAGYAFEALCLKHVAQIKSGLGISGVSTTQSGWRSTTDDQGAQIDLVIDRADNCINLCEMKFSDGQFRIDKHYAEHLRRKLQIFQNATRTRKNLFLTLVTTHGCAHNAYFEELVKTELTMDCLFSDG